MKQLRTSFTALPFLVVAGALAGALTGCGGDEPGEEPTGGKTTSETTTSEETGGGGAGGGVGGSGGDTTGGGGTGGTTVPPAPKQKTISGDVTWNVAFDADAQAVGATDCVYTRHYEGVEDRSAPWLCPSCEVVFLADVEMTVGLEDCFSQVSSVEPAATEWIGYGGGTWWRASAGVMSEQGTAMIEMSSVTTAHTVADVAVTAGGTLGFTIEGNLTLGEQEGDPLNGFVPPATYACGWPKADPPEYTGDYVLTKGGVLPDGLFKDRCGETVRLHDFKGSYLVVDMAAMDCPPCQTMAEQEEQFVMDMAAQGIEVHVVTLLAPSLSNVLGNTTVGMLKNWTMSFDLTSPVLADRAWGLTMFEPAIGVDQVGYPSMAIVSPDLTVLDYSTGFGDFSEIEATILADAQ